MGMTPKTDPEHSLFRARPVSPFLEMGAYEVLWSKQGTTFKSLSEQFALHPGSIPSDFVSQSEARDCATLVKQRLDKAEVRGFGVQVHGAGEYPMQLRDAAYPVALLYYKGWWDLVSSRSVAVVGSRKPSREGLSRARRLARKLVADNFTVVSGLATGIDRIAHETAIEENGRTIAVIGTPLSHVYPKENTSLQRHIAHHFLVVSQVPLIRYESQDYRLNRFFFPERNATMSALTEATIIVEAGETSGTLIQARAALRQKRKLFVHDDCFRNPQLTWPARLARQGAIRIRDYDDVKQYLAAAPCHARQSNVAVSQVLETNRQNLLHQRVHSQSGLFLQ